MSYPASRRWVAKQCRKGVTAGTLAYPASSYRVRHRALHHALVQMMSAMLARVAIDVSTPRREYPLPGPLRGRTRVLSPERIG
jgi:hypothetical protein